MQLGNNRGVKWRRKGERGREKMVVCAAGSVSFDRRGPLCPADAVSHHGPHPLGRGGRRHGPDGGAGRRCLAIAGCPVRRKGRSAPHSPGRHPGPGPRPSGGPAGAEGAGPTLSKKAALFW